MDSAYRDAGVKACVILCDRIKAIGYEYATRSGISIGVKDMLIPDSKKRIIDAASAEVDNIESQYRDGIITVRKNTIRSSTFGPRPRRTCPRK